MGIINYFKGKYKAIGTVIFDGNFKFRNGSVDFKDVNVSNLTSSGFIKITGQIANANTNPDYPDAVLGDSYTIVTNDGKIGGVSGKTVEVGDIVSCIADSATGNEAAVGDNWIVFQGNLNPATENLAGIAKIASSSDVSTETDDSKILTIAKAITKFLKLTGGTILGSITCNQSIADVTSLKVINNKNANDIECELYADGSGIGQGGFNSFTPNKNFVLGVGGSALYIYSPSKFFSGFGSGYILGNPDNSAFIWDGLHTSEQSLYVPSTTTKTFDRRSFTGQSTTTSLTTIATVSITQNTTYTIKATVTGRKSDGSKHASYELVGTFYRTAGDCTQVGTTTKTVIAETDATYDVDLAIGSTTTAVIKCAGNDTIPETVDWSVDVQIFPIVNP